METKPFSLQAPEAIAKEYGGNKQKIGQAAQMGLVDPTAALLAGMFIDRMRSAQAQEQGPPQTVAQQVFAPPAPPAPTAPPPPPMGGPGGPPPMPGGPGMPPPPQMNAPQGMAEGGLAALPIPDGMYDEPVDAQSFGGGGIVAFADGGMYEGFDDVDPVTGLPIDRPPPEAPPQGLAAIAPRPAPPAPPAIPDEKTSIANYQSLIGEVPHKYSDMRAAQFERENSPAAIAEQRRQDRWAAVGQFASALGASKSPNFLQAFNEAAGVTIPGMRKTQEERRAQQRDAIKELANDETATRAERIQTVAGALALRQQQVTNASQQATLDMDAKRLAQELGIATATLLAKAEELKSTQTFTAAQNELNRQSQQSVAAMGRDKPPAFNLTDEAAQSKFNIALRRNNTLPLWTKDSKPGTYRKTPEAVRDDVVSEMFGTALHQEQGGGGSGPYTPPGYHVGPGQ